MDIRRAVLVGLGILFLFAAWAEHAWPWGDLDHEMVCEIDRGDSYGTAREKETDCVIVGSRTPRQ
jgi:hypothetical protein